MNEISKGFHHMNVKKRLLSQQYVCLDLDKRVDFNLAKKLNVLRFPWTRIWTEIYACQLFIDKRAHQIKHMAAQHVVMFILRCLT